MVEKSYASVNLDDMIDATEKIMRDMREQYPALIEQRKFNQIEGRNCWVAMKKCGDLLRALKKERPFFLMVVELGFDEVLVREATKLTVREEVNYGA